MATTLKRAVEREWRKWQATNPWRGKYADGWFASLLLWSGRHALLTALTLLGTFLVASAALLYWPPPYPGFVDFGPREPEKFSVDTLFGGLLGTQVALVAVVYPIVFGFATIFLQRQQATKASIQTYLVASGAKLAGTSSLMLVLGLAGHLAVVSSVDPWTAFAWLVLGAAWLAGNVALTIYFLVRTFDFATPEGRRRARNNYAVTIAWPHEWRRDAASVLAQWPVKYGLFEADDVLNAVDGKAPAFSASKVELQPVVDGVESTFKGRRLVANIRYQFVEWAYRLWRRRALRAPVAPKGKSRGFKRDGPIFVLKALPEPDELAHGEFLAGTTAAPHLNWLERTLIRMAVVYQRAGRFDSELSVIDCLEEARGDIVLTIGSGGTEDFDRQFLALLQLFDDLFEASYCLNDEGEPDNQVLTSSRSSIFGGSKAEEWSAVFSDILTTALARAPQDSHFAEMAVNAPKRLFRRERETLNLPLREMYLGLQFRFLVRILDWGDEQLALYRAALGPAGTTLVALLPEPIASRHREILGEAIGAWETLKNECIVPFDEDWLRWDKDSEQLQLFTQHAAYSVAAIARATRGSELRAVHRLLDSLSRWRRQLEYVLEDQQAYIGEPWQVTVEATARPWLEVKAQLMRGWGDDEALLGEAWAAALANFWRDCCAALAATLAQEARAVDSTEISHASIAIRAVLLGKMDGSRELERPFAGAQEFFQGLIRQYVVDGGYREGYRARKDSVVKRCAKDDWNGQIPGRMVSLRSADSLEDVRGGQLFCLCVLVDKGWKPAVEELGEVFKSWIAIDDRRRELEQVLGGLEAALDGKFESDFGGLWGKVLPEGTSAFADAIVIVRGGLAAIRSALTKAQADDLAKAPISDVACADLASKLSLMLDLRAIGYPFTPSTESTAAPDLVHGVLGQWRLTGYAKGRLTLPRLAAESDGEVEVLRRYIAGRMRGGAIVELLKQLEPKEKLADGTERLLAVLTEFSDALPGGEHAVLLVPSTIDPSWFPEIRGRFAHPTSERSADDVLVRRGGFGDDRAYLGHLRNAAVYAGLTPSGAMYLLSSAALESHRLKEFGQGRVLRLDAATSSNEPTLCNLTFAWESEVSVRRGPCWKLRYLRAEKRKKPSKRLALQR